MAARTSYRSVGGRRAARAGVCGRAARAQRESVNSACGVDVHVACGEYVAVWAWECGLPCVRGNAARGPTGHYSVLEL